MSDLPASEFRVYRPIGLVVTGWVMLHFTDSEQSLRLVGIMFSLFSTLFLFLLVNSIAGLRAAVLSTLLMLSSGLFLLNAPNFLNDVPSSGFIFGVLWILWRYYKTDGRSRLIILLPSLVGLAFYLRYGTVINFATIAIISTLFLWRRFYSKQNISYSGILWSFFGTFLVLIPFFYISISTGNGLTGVLSRGGGAAGRKFLGEGLIEYGKLIPYELGGWAFGVLILLGTVATLFIPLITKLEKEKWLGVFWMGSIALLHLLISGLLVHAEPRYIFFSATILSSVGVIVCVSLANKIKFLFLGHFLLVSLGLLIIYFGVAQYGLAKESFNNKVSSVARGSYVTASELIKQDNPSNKECVIWSTSFRPELSWYSGCYTLTVNEPIDFYRNYLIHLRRDHYSIAFTGVTELQINDSTANSFGVVLEKMHQQKTNSSLGDMIIYRLNKENPVDSKLREEMANKAKNQ